MRNLAIMMAFSAVLALAPATPAGAEDPEEIGGVVQAVSASTGEVRISGQTVRTTLLTEIRWAGGGKTSLAALQPGTQVLLELERPAGAALPVARRITLLPE